VASDLNYKAQLVEAGVLGPQETIETTVDPGGSTVTRIIRGGKAPQGLTPATASQVQQRMIGFEKALGRGAELFSKLSPAMVGVRGLLGEVVVDRGLAQVFPELADKERISGRTLLKMFNQNMMRTLRSDAQMNQKEEHRIEGLLASASAAESLPRAREILETVFDDLRAQATVDAKAAGLPLPDWAWTKDEIVAKAKTGEFTRDKAMELLMRYHP
jgi:hypothetical protein